MKEHIDFFDNGLCTFCFRVIDSLLELKHFHSVTEACWESEYEKINSDLKAILAKTPNAAHEDVISYHAWDLHVNKKHYPAIHRSALVITLHNLLESSLNELCSILTKSNEVSLRVEDLRGAGVERAYVYLDKVCGIRLDSLKNEIEYLQGINALRNVIVHAGGQLNVDKHHKLIKFIQKTPNLKRTHGSTVEISQRLIEEYLSTMIAFFEKLDVKINKYIQRSQQNH